MGQQQVCGAGRCMGQQQVCGADGCMGQQQMCGAGGCRGQQQVCGAGRCRGQQQMCGAGGCRGQQQVCGAVVRMHKRSHVDPGDNEGGTAHCSRPPLPRGVLLHFRPAPAHSAPGGSAERRERGVGMGGGRLPACLPARPYSAMPASPLPPLSPPPPPGFTAAVAGCHYSRLPLQQAPLPLITTLPA